MGNGVAQEEEEEEDKDVKINGKKMTKKRNRVDAADLTSNKVSKTNENSTASSSLSSLLLSSYTTTSSLPLVMNDGHRRFKESGRCKKNCKKCKDEEEEEEEVIVTKTPEIDSGD